MSGKDGLRTSHTMEKRLRESWMVDETNMKAEYLNHGIKADRGKLKR